MSLSKEEQSDIREKAFALVQRAEREPEFASKAKADPLGTLVEGGIPRDTAHRMLFPPMICTDTTCWTSDCPGTCFVSIIWRED